VTKSGRSVLAVVEVHVFTKRDAAELAKEWRVKVLPHTSRIVKGRPVFDGRVFGEKTAEQVAAIAAKAGVR
jgi:hypothetical protein